MPDAKRTLAAIDKFVVANRDKDRRRHLGASVIGDNCARKIFYKFRWAMPADENKPAALLRLFGRGHREEPEFIRLLRGCGFTVYAAGESGDLKEKLRISDCDGHFGGTPDGVIVGLPELPQGAPALLEFKTVKDSLFQKLKADRLMTWNWLYFVQVQVYMDKLDLDYCLFLATNKNDDELYAEIIGRSPTEANRAIARAQSIIGAETPPPRINESPGWWECKFCDFLEICHHRAIPDINCRTCTHAAPGGQGAWVCALGRSEVSDQRGCQNHLFDPSWFSDWTVVRSGTFNGASEIWYEVKDKCDDSVYRLGHGGMDSKFVAQQLLLPPF